MSRKVLGRKTGELCRNSSTASPSYTHQVRLIEELNEVVTECNQRIALLERDNRRFEEMLKSLAPDLPESPDE
jgi:uncharacterized coiled-coil protein SlyX